MTPLVIQLIQAAGRTPLRLSTAVGDILISNGQADPVAATASALTLPSVVANHVSPNDAGRVATGCLNAGQLVINVRTGRLAIGPLSTPARALTEGNGLVDANRTAFLSQFGPLLTFTGNPAMAAVLNRESPDKLPAGWISHGQYTGGSITTDPVLLARCPGDQRGSLARPFSGATVASLGTPSAITFEALYDAYRDATIIDAIVHAALTARISNPELTLQWRNFALGYSPDWMPLNAIVHGAMMIPFGADLGLLSAATLSSDLDPAIPNWLHASAANQRQAGMLTGKIRQALVNARALTASTLTTAQGTALDALAAPLAATNALLYLETVNPGIRARPLQQWHSRMGSVSNSFKLTADGAVTVGSFNSKWADTVETAFAAAIAAAVPSNAWVASLYTVGTAPNLTYHVRATQLGTSATTTTQSVDFRSTLADVDFYESATQPVESVLRSLGYNDVADEMLREEDKRLAMDPPFFYSGQDADERVERYISLKAGEDRNILIMMLQMQEIDRRLRATAWRPA